jgi:imidazolonepropionase
MRADVIIRDAREVLTCRGRAPRRGPAQADVGVVTDASIAARDGHIVFVGPADECRRVVQPSGNAVHIDATGCTVVPGFVDAHTHAVHAGDRRAELRRRLAGATYAEIAAEGGGILNTVAATRDCSEDELIAQSGARLAEMLRCGTTTAEVKSGYGLTIGSELKMLRAIRALSGTQPIELVPTFLGAHAIPIEHRSDREAYVRLVVEEMIPRVAGERLATWCDVFCEEGAFTVDESRRILEAGRRAGLGLRVHADELAPSGGARLAAELGARSADHLVHANRDAARALAAAGTVATLLPAASFYLKLGRFAPARLLIDEGVPVALGTDLNPGGGFSPSMPFAVTLACFGMGMTLEEALVAATINAACSIDRQAVVGSLEPGKQMDAVVVNGSPVELLRAGAAAVRTVIKRGSVVHDASGAS